jgi:uncharacterized coiled-coil protein SlyX
MARRRSARHTRPTGRRALEAAHAQLEDDVSALRIQRYADHLELVRLTALVEGLVAHVQRLAIELAEMRRELQVARTAPQQRDPAVAQLAAQVADLRATVATQQSMLSELSGRLLDVMSRLGPDPWSTHPDAASPEVPAAVPVAAPEVAPPAYAAEPEVAQPVFAVAPEVAPPAYAVAPEVAQPAYALAPEVAQPAYVAEPAPAAASAVPVAPSPTHDLRDPALPTVPDYPPPPDEHVVTLTGIPASVSAAAAEMSRREPILAEVAASTPGFRQFASPTSDVDALDDETVLRLRMIRESFGR